MRISRRAGAAALAGAATAARQTAAPKDATDAVAGHKQAFRVGAKDAFRQRGTTVLDTDGGAHVRYDRTYQARLEGAVSSVTARRVVDALGAPRGSPAR